MKQEQVDKILELGIQLTSERSYDELLAKIIDCAMELTDSDGGTLYLYEEQQLKFCIMKNKSMGINRERVDEKKHYPPVPMDEKNVCAYAAIHRKLMNIKDAYHCEDFDFSGPREYDKLNGYRTQSILVFPLVNHEGNLVGVVQLINAKNEQGQVIPFSKEYEKVLQSLGSQAAVAVSNMRFTEEIKQLMISITQVFTDTIDTRTPYNYYHSRNVSIYVQMMMDYINKKHKQGKLSHYFSSAKKEELFMAALLHDIGKLVIPNEVINKNTRLGGKFPLVLERFDHLITLYHIDYLEGKISKSKWVEMKNLLIDAKARIEEINRKPRLTDEDVAFVQGLADQRYFASDSRMIAFLTAEETECLSVRVGNLTKEERDIIKSHVVYTERYLNKMKFGERYSHIIEWAGAHHELLDGSGYPRGLKGDQISFEVRILTLIDVFEALTSSDRPYKKSLEVDKALDVLEDMADEGKIDKEVLGLFREALAERGGDIQLFYQREDTEDA